MTKTFKYNFMLWENLCHWILQLSND